MPYFSDLGFMADLGLPGKPTISHHQKVHRNGHLGEWVLSKFYIETYFKDRFMHRGHRIVTSSHLDCLRDAMRQPNSMVQSSMASASEIRCASTSLLS